jgi:hypothetical protein
MGAAEVRACDARGFTVSSARPRQARKMRAKCYLDAMGTANELQLQRLEEQHVMEEASTAHACHMAAHPTSATSAAQASPQGPQTPQRYQTCDAVRLPRVQDRRPP